MNTWMDQSRPKQDAVLKNIQRRVMRSKKNIVSNTAPIANKYKDSLSDVDDDFEHDSDSRSPKANPCLSSELPPTRKTNLAYRSVSAAKSSSPLASKRDRPRKVS